jgi:DNA-binding XRE family transcriptional regulator
MSYKEEYIKHRAERLPSKEQRWKFAMLRKNKGLTQNELAKEFGVNQSRLSNFERGISPDPDSEFLFYCYTKKFN